MALKTILKGSHRAAFWIGASILMYLVIIADNQPAWAACERTYRMAHSGDYVPYQYQSSEGELIGLDVDLARAIFSRMECEITFVKLPPKRAQVMLGTGELDIMAAASITAERHVYAHFSLPYRDERVVLFAKTENIPDFGDLDLKEAFDRKLRVTAGIGGWYGPDYEKIRAEAEAANLLQLNNSTAARIRQLLNDRVDLVIADLYVGYHHAAQLDAREDIRELPYILNNDPVHFMLSRKNVDGRFLDRFNQALLQLQASPEYHDLILEYRPRELD